MCISLAASLVVILSSIGFRVKCTPPPPSNNTPKWHMSPKQSRAAQHMYCTWAHVLRLCLVASLHCPPPPLSRTMAMPPFAAANCFPSYFAHFSCAHICNRMDLVCAVLCVGVVRYVLLLFKYAHKISSVAPHPQSTSSIAAKGLLGAFKAYAEAWVAGTTTTTRNTNHI